MFDHPHDYERDIADEEMCVHMDICSDKNRACSELALHYLERFFDLPQAFVDQPYLGVRQIFLAGHYGVIAVILRFLVDLFLVQFQRCSIYDLPGYLRE